VTAWSGGQLQVDALVDEIQHIWVLVLCLVFVFIPMTKFLGLAMICESITSSNMWKLDHPSWLVNPSALLILVVVDLALPGITESGYNISLFIDMLMLERIHSLHDGEIDYTVLHFLPFTS